jgi:hypothetical protein
MGTTMSEERSTSVLRDEKNQAGNILWEWPNIARYFKGVMRAQSGQWKPYATERKNNSVQEEKKSNFTVEDEGSSLEQLIFNFHATKWCDNPQGQNMYLHNRENHSSEK